MLALDLLYSVNNAYVRSTCKARHSSPAKQAILMADTAFLESMIAD